MTRANLNFIWQHDGEAPRSLFHYHNGDQYPEGLLQFFGIEEFLRLPRLWTPDDFRIWIRANYRVPCRKITTLGNGLTLDTHAESEEPAEPEDLGEAGQPKIFYTDGFITDYSYVFTHHGAYGRRRKDGDRPYTCVNWVTAWRWNKLIFDGRATQFLKFLQKRVRPVALPGDVAAVSTVTSLLSSLPTSDR